MHKLQRLHISTTKVFILRWQNFEKKKIITNTFFFVTNTFIFATNTFFWLTNTALYLANKTISAQNQTFLIMLLSSRGRWVWVIDYLGTTSNLLQYSLRKNWFHFMFFLKNASICTKYYACTIRQLLFLFWKYKILRKKNHHEYFFFCHEYFFFCYEYFFLTYEYCTVSYEQNHLSTKPNFFDYGHMLTGRVGMWWGLVKDLCKSLLIQLNNIFIHFCI